MTKDEWPGWTSWTPLATVGPATLPFLPGTYMIGAGREIQRARHVDVEGILTIGTTGSLATRVEEFRQCASGRRKAGHMAGVRYRWLNMKTFFPFEKLQVCWRIAVCEDEAAVEEGRLLQEYRDYHLENPPLNYAASYAHNAISS